MMNPVQQKWITKLLGLNYEIQYKVGAENKAADALSRCLGNGGDCFRLTIVVPLWMQKVKSSYDGDAHITQILTSKAIDPSTYAEYKLENGILRYKDRITIGSATTLRSEIFSEVHDTLFGGHSGVMGTYSRLKAFFYWPNIKKEVEKMVRECDICQRNKVEHNPYPSLLQPLPIPDKAWTHISMDFVEGLPKSAGKNVILVVVDMFLDNIYKLHGPPVSILPDRDKVFTSLFWRELFKLMETKLDMSSAYHPQTDGQIERLNQCLETYIRCMVGAAPKQWARWLPLAEYWDNTNYHSGLKCTPYQVLYGMPPPHIGIRSYLHTDNHEVKEWLMQKQEMVRRLKENLKFAQAQMEFYSNLKRSERSFEVGESVYLKLQPFCQDSVALRRNQKLAARYYGPYKIIEKVGKVAYKLDLPETSKIHPVFHVSLLKKCLGKDVLPNEELPDVDAEGHFKMTHFAILQRCVIRRGSIEVPQAQVQWLKGDLKVTSWEDLKGLNRKFGKADPWGQGSLDGKGIVMNMIVEGVKEEKSMKKKEEARTESREEDRVD